MPMLVDRIDNDIDRKYVGLPMRQFLIDSEGKIAYVDGKARAAGTTTPSRPRSGRNSPKARLC